MKSLHLELLRPSNGPDFARAMREARRRNYDGVDLEALLEVSRKLLEMAAHYRSRCEGLTAHWCWCGDCTCDWEDGVGDPNCQLHASASIHTGDIEGTGVRQALDWMVENVDVTDKYAVVKLFNTIRLLPHPPSWTGYEVPVRQHALALGMRLLQRAKPRVWHERLYVFLRRHFGRDRIDRVVSVDWYGVIRWDGATVYPDGRLAYGGKSPELPLLQVEDLR